jgi:predicted acetyltransferase
MPPVIEVMTFRLVEDTDEDAFVKADATAQVDYAYQQHGLVRRTTARGEDGDWLVMTMWASAEDAYHAAEAALDDPAATAWLAMIDDESIVTRRFDPLPG